MKDPQQIVNALMWAVIVGLGSAILCTIIYYTVYRKRLPCIEKKHEKKDALKEKEKEMIKNEMMPELQFGDVVKCDEMGYMLVGNTAAYPLMAVDGLYGPQGTRVELKRILDGPYFPLRLYRTGASGFNQHALKAIYNDLGGGYIIWERPAVKEMTVDEISKELGYTVKVVGKK